MEVTRLAVVLESDGDCRERRQDLEAVFISMAPSYRGRPFRCIRVAAGDGRVAYHYVARARALCGTLPWE